MIFALDQKIKIRNEPKQKINIWKFGAGHDLPEIFPKSVKPGAHSGTI